MPGRERRFEDRFAGVGVDDALGNTVTVAQIQENQSTQVAAPMHPTHQGHLLTDVFGTDLITCVSAA